MRTGNWYNGLLLSVTGFLCLSLLFACNAFDWTYSAESSNDFRLVMDEADSCFRDADYSRALALYSRAVGLRTNAAAPRYGRIRCRLLIAAHPEPVMHRFAVFFKLEPSTNRLFAGESPLALAERLSSFSLGMADLAAIGRGGDDAFDTNAPAVLADGALLAAIHGCLVLADDDGDGIPFSEGDRIGIDTAFRLDVAVATNSLQTVIDKASADWETAMMLLRRLFTREPFWNQSGGVFHNLLANLGTVRSNAAAVADGSGP